MNQKTLDFIKNHWQILIDPAAERFAAVIDASPLASVAAITTELQHQGTLSIEDLAERTGLNRNSIAQITRLLEGKLFERSVKTQTYISWIARVQESAPTQPAIPEKRSMKFLCHLPDHKFYRAIQSTKADRWIFEDAQAQAFQIISPVPNPWGQEWKIVFSKQFQKSDNSKWPYRLQLKLFEPDQEQVPTAKILREDYKGIFGYTEEITAAFYSYPYSEKNKIWISYSVVLKHSER
ncbi:MAG: hypothetical protein HC851_24190 [Acaryochloris sp. RU_4_1]|nr:hypothetical protein [Acaryochloris sp. RU_4_1]NJR56961.1 hypothetical protein [Acaryochloris sp. CRU_2_0]